MRKGDLVVELGDDGHTGKYVARVGSLVAVRWAKKCLRWHDRHSLRNANSTEKEKYLEAQGHSTPATH